MKLRTRAKVPFADESRGITRRLEPVGDSFFFHVQPGELGIETGRIVIKIVVVTETNLHSPRQQSRARRTAHRRGNVALREAHARRRERVNVRCLDLRAALVADVTVAQVIRNNEDEVGRRGTRRFRC